MKRLITTVFVIMSVGAIAQQGKKHPYRLTRTLVADLNNDNRPDTIRLFSTLDDWNSFDKISISLTGYGKTTFKARDYWTMVDSFFLVKNKNAIHTKLLFLKSTPVHSVILLFGEIDGAGYRGEFSILNIENNKVKMVFDPFNDSNNEPDIEWPETLVDIEGNGRLCFLYKTLTEFYGQRTNGMIGTYTPYYVYPIKDTCSISRPLMKKYNEGHYVFAGYESSEKIKIFYPANKGKPRVWKEKIKKKQ